MSVIRAFIAIDLTDDIRKRIKQVTGQLIKRLEGVPIRWVPADNIHLTLKFLGDVSMANLGILQELLQTEVAGHHFFEFSAGSIGAFPGPKRPRVIWVGIEAPPELLNLQRGIETAVARLGYAREERPFSAHLTLGRVSRNANSTDLHKIGAVLEAAKVGFMGVARADQVHLFRSDLKPDGAVYTRIFSAPLKSTDIRSTER
jgi:RNA 2',3'-cyclic 3'-phosphodiesterase